MVKGRTHAPESLDGLQKMESFDLRLKYEYEVTEKIPGTAGVKMGIRTLIWTPAYILA